MTLKRCYLILFLLLAAAITDQAFAESGNEDAVKTAFLYNFFKFIDWPKAASTEKVLNLCTTNDDHLGDSLWVIKNKTIGNTPIFIRRGINDDTLKTCHMVFISGSNNDEAIIKNLKGLPIVTVSDMPGFIDHGGMIGLVRADNRLSFEINIDTVNASSVHIGTQMLKLAKRINTEK